MLEHSFALILGGEDDDDVVEAKMDELFEAGCGDATFGSSDGLSYAHFDRQAQTFEEAISSAIADVESVEGLRVRRVVRASAEGGETTLGKEKDEQTVGFELAGEGPVGEEALIRFEAHRYGIAEPPSDVDWLKGTFLARAGPWSGSFEGTVFQKELARLLAQIETSLKTPHFEIAFEPAEPHLVFEVEGPASERVYTEGISSEDDDEVVIEGRLDHSPILGTELRFVFTSDRKRLAQTARGIREVLARFPDRVRSEPGKG